MIHSLRVSVFRRVRPAFVALGATLALAGSPGSVSAQVVPPGTDLRQLAQSLSPEEIIRRLEASGLTRAQVRDRLRTPGLP